MLNSNEFCKGENKLGVDTCHLHSRNEDYELHDSYKCEVEMKRHRLCCGCCECDESAASLSSVKSKFIEEWLNAMPSKAEPIIPEELVEVFKFFKQQSMEQIKLASILKECKTEPKKPNNEQYQIAGRKVKRLNTLHFVKEHKNEDEEKYDNSVSENKERRGSYDHLLTSEWMHKLPFFSSCMQDLTTDKASFVNENVSNENGVKTCDKHITCTNVSEDANKMFLHSSSIIPHKSSQQNLLKRELTSVQKSVAKTKDINDYDACNEGEYCDEGGLTSVQQSTNNYNSTRKTSTVVKTSFNSISLHLECEEDMQFNYCPEVCNKTPCDIASVKANINDKNDLNPNQSNYKLNKSNDKNDENHNDVNDHYSQKVQADNKNTTIKDVNKVYLVKPKIY